MATTIIRNNKESVAAWKMRGPVDITSIREYSLSVDNGGKITLDEPITFFRGEFGGALVVRPGENELPRENYSYHLKMNGVEEVLNGTYEDGVVRFTITDSWTRNAGSVKCLFIIKEVIDELGNYNQKEVFVSNEFTVKIAESLWVDGESILLASENEDLLELHRDVIEINLSERKLILSSTNFGNEGDRNVTLIRLNVDEKEADKYIIFSQDKQIVYKFKFEGDYCVIPEEITTRGGSWYVNIVWEKTDERIISNILTGRVKENFLNQGIVDQEIFDNNGIAIASVDEQLLTAEGIGSYKLDFTGEEIDEKLKEVNKLKENTDKLDSKKLNFENNTDNKITLQSSSRVKIGSSDKTKIGYSNTGNVDDYDGDVKGNTGTGKVVWEFEEGKATLRGSDNAPYIQLNENTEYFETYYKGISTGLKSSEYYVKLRFDGTDVFHADENKTEIKTSTGDVVFCAESYIDNSGFKVSSNNTSVLGRDVIDLIPNNDESINTIDFASKNRIKIGGYEYVRKEDIEDTNTQEVIFAYKPANSTDKVVPFAITTDGKAYYQGKELNTGGSEIKVIELPANNANSEPPFKLPDGITYDDFNKDVIIHVTGPDFPNDVYISGSNMALLPGNGEENPPLAKVFCWTMLNILLALIVLEDNTYILSNETLGFDSVNTYDKEQINSFLNEKADVTVTEDLYNQISDLSSVVNTKANSSDLNNYYTKSQTENLIATSGGGSGSTKVISITDPGDYEEHELPDGLTYEDFTDGTIIKLVQTSSDDSGNVIARAGIIYEHEGTLEIADGSECYKTFKQPIDITAEEFSFSGGVPTLPYVTGDERIAIHLTNGVCTFKKTTSYYSSSTKRLNEFIISEFDSVYEVINTKAEQSDVDTLKSKIKTIELYCDDGIDQYKSNTILDLPQGVTYDDFNEYVAIRLFFFGSTQNHLNGLYVYLSGVSMTTGQMEYTDGEGNTKTTSIKQFTYTVPTETCMMTYIVAVADINKYMWYKTYSSDYYYTKNETDSQIDTKIAEYMNANYENGDNGSY